MAQRMLEDLRQKLLSRLDALNKKRGQFQNLNSFIEFRNAAGVQKGKSVDFNGFKKALNQFDCPGRHNDSIVQKAFGILTRKDQNVSTNDLSITFNHFKSWCAIRDANEERKKARKKATKSRMNPSNHKTNSDLDNMCLTGRSLASEVTSEVTTTPKYVGRKPSKNKLPLQRGNTLQPLSEKMSNEDPIILMDGHELRVSELYLMLKKKIIGRHPGGSHGILRCWKQFRRLAGAGRVGGGGKGAGVVTREELNVAFRNYGLPLDRSEDLDLIFRRFDKNKDGLISF